VAKIGEAVLKVTGIVILPVEKLSIIGNNLALPGIP
jgi:hypothetical protein